MKRETESRRTPTEEELAKQIGSGLDTDQKYSSAELIGEGSNNGIYLLHGAETPVVVKLSKPDAEHRALGDYQKERWCLEKAHELGIPSPSVWAVGEQGDRAYAVHSYVEGQPVAKLDDSSPFSKEEQDAVWRKLGEYARKIHSVSAQEAEENLGSDGISKGSWDKHIQYNIDSLQDDDPLLEMGVITRQQSEDIRAAFSALKEAKFNFGLSHSDLALRNTIKDAEGIVYLLDWGSARVDVVPYFDFNEVLTASKPDAESLQAFLDGYGMSSEAFENMRRDLVMLDLLYKIDTLRWAIDKKPQAIPEYVERAKSSIAQFQQLTDQAN